MRVRWVMQVMLARAQARHHRLHWTVCFCISMLDPADRVQQEVGAFGEFWEGAGREEPPVGMSMYCSSLCQDGCLRFVHDVLWYMVCFVCCVLCVLCAICAVCYVCVVLALTILPGLPQLPLGSTLSCLTTSV